MNDASTDKRMLQFVERAERLIEERRGLNDDLRDVFAEAKALGYDAPTIKWAIKERAIDEQKRKERDALRETYGIQLGIL